jgi:hypothetical protein
VHSMSPPVGRPFRNARDKGICVLDPRRLSLHLFYTTRGYYERFKTLQEPDHVSAGGRRFKTSTHACSPFHLCVIQATGNSSKKPRYQSLISPSAAGSSFVRIKTHWCDEMFVRSSAFFYSITPWKEGEKTLYFF